LNEKIGERIKKIRISKGIKANYVCKKLGYKSPSYFSEIENGKRRLDANKVPMVAEILGVSVEYLFFGENNREMRINKTI